MKTIIAQLFGIAGVSFATLLVGNPARALEITATTYGSNADLEKAVKNSLLGLPLDSDLNSTSGMTINSVTYSGSLLATGIFLNGLTTGTGGLGIDKGIVLTTGWASNITGSNTNGSISGDNGLGGDALLGALIPGYNTFDASRLDINFTTTAANLYFNYAFGSDEYNEWVHTAYNDVFGFFIDGINIALVPGSGGAPVSINNVNGFDNPGYYKDNEAGPFNFEYDGFTKVLSASALGLGPGTHTITLAIADAGDHIYDSGVFIQMGTFSGVQSEDDDGNLPDDSGVNFSTSDEGATAAFVGIALCVLAAVRRRLR